MNWRYALIVPIVVAVPWLGAQAYYAGRILPNTYIQNTPIGGLTLQQARQRVEEQKVTPPQVTIQVGKVSKTVAADTLGWSFNPDATLGTLAAESRSAPIWSRFLPQDKRTIPPVAVIDIQKLRPILQTLGKTEEKAAVNAKAVFTKDRYTIVADQTGLALDLDTAVRAYQAKPLGTAITVPLKSTTAKVTSATLKPKVDAANALIRPLKALYPKGSKTEIYTFAPNQVADLFWLKEAGIEVDPVGIQKAVSRIAATYDVAPNNASYNISGSAISKIPERIGWKLDQAAAQKALSAAITDVKVSEIKLTVSQKTPLISLAKLPDPSTLKEIHSATTYFYGSPPARRANVAAAASHLNGHVIAPDEVFSFLGAIGDINTGRGYRTALVISGGRTVEGIGGGVCQVSTTTFRAMYGAGLPVVERNQHAYRVHYYDPLVGYEAAVYQPGVDLKMKNDTGAPIIVRAWTGNNGYSLTVQLTGKSDGRKVYVGPGRILSRTPHPPAQYLTDRSIRRGTMRQVDYAVDGYRININRSVTYANGKVLQDNVFTNYKPWRAVFLTNY